MKNYISIIMLVLAFTSMAQTPAPSGTWYRNATEKNLSEIKGFPTFDANNVLNGWVDKSILDKNMTFYNVKDYGAIGDGIADDSDAINVALQLAKNTSIKKVYLPEGIYSISKTLRIPSDIEFFGSGRETSTIRTNSNAASNLDLIRVLDGMTSQNLYDWRTIIATEGADYNVADTVRNIIIRDLGVDWNGTNVGINSSLPIMISRAENVWLDNVKIYDANALDMVGQPVRHGKSILFAFAKDSGIKNSWIGSADYESVSAWFLSENITILRNVFYMNKPDEYSAQLHAIQTARPSHAATPLTNLYGRTKTVNTYVEGNTFYIGNRIRHAYTAHTSDGVYLRYNTVKIINDFDEQFFGFKPFADTNDVSIQGNLIDFRDYNLNQFGSSAISIGTVVPEAITMKNIKIDNNQILIKNKTPFSGTTFYQGSSILGGFQTYSENVSITNNSIDIDGYDNTIQAIIGASGTNINVSGNTITLKNPFETITGTNGFVLLNSWGGSNISFSNNIVTGDLSRGVRIETKTRPFESMKIFDNTFTSIGARINNETGVGTIKFGLESVNGTFPDQNGNVTVSSGGSGTVTSVGMTSPTGLTVSGSPITTSGTLALGLQSGYSIPTTANQANWTTGYDYSQIGHLPLAGGNLSGFLNFTGEIQIRRGGVTRLSSTGSNTLLGSNGIINFRPAGVGAMSNEVTIGTDGIISTTNGNGTSANWASAYAYSQIGHLPLAGNQTVSGTKSFSDIQNFDERITVDDIIQMEQSAAYTYGYTLTNEASIQATNSGYAFGITSGANERKSVQFMFQNLTPNVANNIIIPAIGSGSGGNTTMVVTSTLNGLIETYLKSLPSYNASTAQVLGHDASGNLEWQAK